MMLLNLFDELEKLSDKFKDWLMNSNQWVILGLFFGFFLIFVIAWNALHKND